MNELEKGFKKIREEANNINVYIAENIGRAKYVSSNKYNVTIELDGYELDIWIANSLDSCRVYAQRPGDMSLFNLNVDIKYDHKEKLWNGCLQLIENNH